MTTTLSITFTPEASAWLDANVKSLLSGNRKRLAFQFSVDELDMLLVADMMGKTVPEYTIRPDEGEDTIEINGKPVAVVSAPDNVANFEALMSGASIAFPTADEDAEFEALVAETIHADESEEFNPVVKEVSLVTEDAPALIPMPSPAKKGRGKGKKVKAAVVTKTYREKILDKLCAELGVKIPTPEVMFRHVASKSGVEMAPFSTLAAMNHPAYLIQNAKGDFAKGLAEVVHGHRDNAIRNTLNLSAECDPNRVLAIVGSLLRFGRLIHEIQTCLITDSFPHSATLDATGTQVETFDPKAEQIWSGRHRALALAFIYGPDVEIPVSAQELTYKEAVENCLTSNMVRGIGKREEIHYDSVIRSLTVGDNEAAQFESLKGDKKKIAKFISYHTVVSNDSDLFYRPKTLQVADKRTVHNITTPFYRSALEFALSTSGLTHAVKLDNKTSKGINMVIKSLDHLFKRFTEEFKLDAERKQTWTYYSAGAYGILLGEALHPFIAGTSKGDGAEEAAEAVMNMVVTMFRTDDNAKSKLAKEPPASLSNILSFYGETDTESEDDAAESLMG